VGLNKSVIDTYASVKEKVMRALEHYGFKVVVETSMPNLTDARTMRQRGITYKHHEVLFVFHPELAAKLDKLNQSSSQLLSFTIGLREDQAQVDISISDPEPMFKHWGMHNEPIALLFIQSKTLLNKVLEAVA